METNLKNKSYCIVDSAHGQFIPQVFLETHNPNTWELNVNDEDLTSIQNGPEDEFYWESWEKLMNNAVCVIENEKFTLFQDNDLFIINEDYDFESGDLNL